MSSDMTLRGLTLKINEYYRVTKQDYPTITNATLTLSYYLDCFCEHLLRHETSGFEYRHNITEIFINLLIIAELSNIQLDKEMLGKLQIKINEQI